MLDRAETQGFTCPACGYDVSATLDAGFGTCPECGGAVSREMFAETSEANEPRNVVFRFAAGAGACWAGALAAPVLVSLANVPHGYGASGTLVFVLAGLVLVVVGGVRAHRATDLALEAHGGRLGAVDRAIGKVLNVFFCSLFAGLIFVSGVFMVMTIVRWP